MAVVRNIHVNPKLVPGGGAIEMELAHRLNEKAKTIEGIEQLPFKAGSFLNFNLNFSCFCIGNYSSHISLKLWC